MARLIANLPLLRWGFPPVTIPVERRVEYIETLARWQLVSGRPRPGADLVPETVEFQTFIDFCRDAASAVASLIA
jgi:Fic family protein